MPQELDELLDRLTVTTEALARASNDTLGASFRTLLDERETQLRTLKALVNEVPIEAHHAERIERILAAGHDVQGPLSVQRAVTRKRFEDLRAARRARRALTPPQEARGRRLDLRA